MKNKIIIFIILISLFTVVSCTKKPESTNESIKIMDQTKDLSSLKIATVLSTPAATEYFQNALAENDVIIVYPQQIPSLYQEFSASKALIADTANELISYFSRTPGIQFKYLIYDPTNRGNQPIAESISNLRKSASTAQLKIAAILDRESLEKYGEIIVNDLNMIIIKSTEWQDDVKIYSSNIALLAAKLRKQKPELEIFTELISYPEKSDEGKRGSEKMIDLAASIANQIDGLFIKYNDDNKTGMQYFLQKIRIKDTNNPGS